jgi:uncharacterized protein (TIGR02246 family)
MMNQNEESIVDVLTAYEKALNASDTAAVMQLYAPDGVFMPQHFPSSVGSDAVTAAYDAVFAAIKLTVKFSIAEVKKIAPDWAIARTNSAGTVRINATGSVAAEANQELFVFQKIDGAWKIARYAFSTTNPPAS